MRIEIDSRQVDVRCQEELPPVALDPRLVKLGMKQLLDNSLKYSPAGDARNDPVQRDAGSVTLDVTSQGKEIPLQDRAGFLRGSTEALRNASDSWLGSRSQHRSPDCAGA